MKTFNEKVKRMHKSNTATSRDSLLGIHELDNGWVEYTDGKVLVRAKDQTFLSDEIATHKKLPIKCKPDVQYPKADHLFATTEVKSSIKLQKGTLLKLLDMFENDESIQFDIRGESNAITVIAKNFKGLIMPLK